MTETQAAHLVPEISSRGLKYLPLIEGDRGGYARVYESSAALGPHVWLQVVVPGDEMAAIEAEKATLHLTVEDAQRLSEQLAFIAANHYQVSPAADDHTEVMGRESDGPERPSR